MERPPAFHFLHHDTEHQLLICRICNFVLNASSAAQHCYVVSHPNTSLIERKPAENWALTLDIYSTEPWDFNQVLPQPIPYLELFTGALLCDYPSCQYPCIKESTLKKQSQSVHPASNLRSRQSKLLTKCSAS
jgi:hypothetical protein